ncbi:hypothetical protein H072_455 [Dactylellina haptotyla CBS 200.50]|uniref:C2H2-type domain-containing protein n=1 Tax=Dactylellina haptotyla (strain CBS 200.50) TaxID=1284197 RepID=S8C1F7_DACHA|nr:hypothetical protein H072_455 [Dactylellina haptotyla CBS 200.50]
MEQDEDNNERNDGSSISQGQGARVVISIYELTLRCHDLFVGILAQSETMHFDAIETQFGRLNIWASNIGACAGGKMSLDYRLRYTDDIKTMIVELLEILERNLKRMNTEQPDKNGLSNKEDTLLESFVDGIQAASDSIDRLQTLANLIRRSSSQSRNLRATSFEDEDDGDFEGFVLIMLRHRFKDANLALCEQLAASLAMRRKRFRYKSKHQSKLANTSRPVVQSQTQEFSPVLNVLHKVESPEPLLESGFSSTPVSQDTLRPLEYFPKLEFMSQTNASTLDTKIFRKMLRENKPARSTISKGTSVWDPTLEYPPPPKAGIRQRECICPYCCELIPASRTNNRRLWQQHVDSDLEPYVCISEKCSAAPIHFSKYEDWLRHMSDHGPSVTAWDVHLSAWKCPICENSEGFRWKPDFVNHIESSHGDRFTSGQLNTLSKRNIISIPRDKFVCPFCDCVPPDIELITPENRDKFEDALPKHIAGHLKSCALLALPHRDDISDRVSEASREHDIVIGSTQGDEHENSFPEIDFVEFMAEGIKEPPMSTDEVFLRPEGPEPLCGEEEITDWSYLPSKMHEDKDDVILQHFRSMKRTEKPLVIDLKTEDPQPLLTPTSLDTSDKQNLVLIDESIGNNNTANEASNLTTLKVLNNMTYEDTLSGILDPNKKTFKITERALMWVLRAGRRLSPVELSYAVAIEIGETELKLTQESILDCSEILQHCGGLITTRVILEHSNMVYCDMQPRFRVYLERSWSKWFGATQYRITDACATYLSFGTFRTGEVSDEQLLKNRFKENPLYNYCAKYWGYHAAEEPLSITPIFNFLCQRNCVSACYQGMLTSQRGSFSFDISHFLNLIVTEIHLLAYFGADKYLEVVFSDSKRGERIWPHGSLADWEDARKRTPLSWAAEMGHVKAIEVLLENGADINHGDLSGRTPLLWAAMNGKSDAASVLIRHGASIDVVEKEEARTALILATMGGYVATVTLLLDCGADPGHVDYQGKTCLIYAIKNSDLALVHIIVSGGADLEKSFLGMTPLLWAIEQGHLPIVQFLLGRGANPHAADIIGNTADILAADKGDKDIMELLTQYSSD